MPDACVLYLLWFRVKQEDSSYKRFADVYLSKGCPLEIEKKLKRMKLSKPIRYTCWDCSAEVQQSPKERQSEPALLLARWGVAELTLWKKTFAR